MKGLISVLILAALILVGTVFFISQAQEGSMATAFVASRPAHQQSGDPRIQSQGFDSITSSDVLEPAISRPEH